MAANSTGRFWAGACYKQSMSLSQPSFGEMLKRARRAAGLTQEALATRAGLSGRVISDLERHVQHAPRPATVRLLVEALPISASERAFLIELATASSVDASLQVTEAAAPRAPTMVDRVSERSTLEALLSGGPATLFSRATRVLVRRACSTKQLGSAHNTVGTSYAVPPGHQGHSVPRTRWWPRCGATSNHARPLSSGMP